MESSCQPRVYAPEPAVALNALQEEILRLKRERNALILAHNYQIAEIQRVADFTGDSLGLSRKAAEVKDADIIVFCGVHFMAETAKILNPSKKVLLPDLEAGCSLADSCPADALARYQKENPGLYTVAYINCSAAVKALSDIIVTSGNAEKIVAKIPADKEILFVPDQNLGAWVAQKTGRKLRLWPGNCHVHARFAAESVAELRERFPEAPVLAHPECPQSVRDCADEVCSTERMLGFCREHPSDTFIVLTEPDMAHRLRRDVPGKTFVFPTVRRAGEACDCFYCEHMKRNTLEKLRDCLKNLAPEIDVPEDVRCRAYAPIAAMLDWSR